MGLTKFVIAEAAFMAPWKRPAGMVPEPVKVPFAPFGQAAGPLPSPVHLYRLVVSVEPPTSKDSSTSPLERHGIVVPVAFVQTLDLWLSSKVRKELPVVSLRKKAKWPK